MIQSSIIQQTIFEDETIKIWEFVFGKCIYLSVPPSVCQSCDMNEAISTELTANYRMRN